jgi:hypothetical protein
MATRNSGAASMDLEAYESFVVRIWRKPAANTGEPQWCGEIEQIQSGVRWGFSTLTDLLAFLQQAAGDRHTTNVNFTNVNFTNVTTNKGDNNGNL